MNRRIAIRNMALILGSVAVLPSCLNEKGKPTIALKHLKLDADQENLVNNLTETILPKTDTPGAKELGINLFVFKMIDDCFNKEQQETFMAGLKEFDEAADKKYGHSFNECSVQQRTEFVNGFEQESKNKKKDGKEKKNKKDKEEPEEKLKTFYWMVKGQTVFGYTTSKYFMTKQVVYELVPGRYNAMFPVKKEGISIMANLNIDSIKERTFDAIVIGSGMSGGFAAKELGDKGLKTLILERGRDVKHLKDYPTTNLYPWEFPHHGEVPADIQEANPIVNRCYAFGEDAMHFFVKDAEHPYVQEKPFDWIRGYQVGGKSLLWARQTQRWSEFDFEGPARDGFAVDWPIRYKDIAPWYSHVEKFAGISGNRDGIAELPDGEFLPAFPLNAVENYFSKHVKANYQNRHVISARCAHLSKPNPIHIQQGRGQCQERTLCQRGCPFGGYFSANSSTIPWALRSGNCTLRPFSVVESIIYDEKLGKATGVRVIDTNTKESIEYYADVIFLNAAALNSNLVLLNSTSNRFPNGLGNDSGTLGKYVAFHNYSARISAAYDGAKEWTTDGRNPAGGGYIPRFRNVYKQETGFLRGYASGFSAYRSRARSSDGIGEELKKNLVKDELNGWRVGSHMMGETIPKESNYVALDKSQKDRWGVPLLKISVEYDDNDAKMKQDYIEQMTEMFTSAGFTDIKSNTDNRAPGLDIHEMGGVRMGLDPKTSMLDKWNRLHACKNVYVTDGASMTSTSSQNPSLTYMAFAARAVDHWAGEKKKLNS